MKHICMLLNNCIFNDSRVIKTITTLSLCNMVDLYYIDSNEKDVTLFNCNVRLFPINRKNISIKTKIIRNCT